MRTAIFAALLVATLGAGCASKPTSDEPVRGSARFANETRSSGSWTYAFDAGPGVATATLTGSAGVLVRVTCQAPEGDLQITDYTFSKAGGGASPTTIYVGQTAKEVLGSVGSAGSGQALAARVSPVDPVWRNLGPSSEVRVAAAGMLHRWADGGGEKVRDVINSCRTIGS